MNASGEAVRGLVKSPVEFPFIHRFANGESEEIHREGALDSLNIRRERRKIILKEEQERDFRE